MKRLCRIEPKNPRFPLTQFLSQCHRILRHEHGIRFIVAFSDPAHNHNGGIYRAANFKHLGKTNPEWHVKDRDGVLRHRRLALRYMNRHNDFLPAGTEPMTLQEAREILGLERVMTPRKDRWFLDLGGDHGQN